MMIGTPPIFFITNDILEETMYCTCVNSICCCRKLTRITSRIFLYNLAGIILHKSNMHDFWGRPSTFKATCLESHSDKSFLTIGFDFVIIRIMISLVLLQNNFAVWIKIMIIPTFTIWNYFPILLILIFCSFYLFHIMFQSQIYFYQFPKASEYLSMSTTKIFI